MVNPFDWRTVVLAKHAQHVVLIHFPIALFIAGVAFDLFARGKRAQLMAGAAFLNLSGAALMVFPTAMTGLLAWKFALEGVSLKGMLLWHLVAASAAILLVLVSWWIHWTNRNSQSETLPSYRFAVEILGVALIALTAHLGGFLSGVNV
jgi:uncharacterized membrane protein